MKKIFDISLSPNNYTKKYIKSVTTFDEGEIKETVIVDMNGNIYPYKLISITDNYIRGIFDVPFDMKTITGYKISYSQTMDLSDKIISIEHLNIIITDIFIQKDIIELEYNEKEDKYVKRIMEY